MEARLRVLAALAAASLATTLQAFGCRDPSPGPNQPPPKPHLEFEVFPCKERYRAANRPNDCELNARQNGRYEIQIWARTDPGVLLEPVVSSTSSVVMTTKVDGGLRWALSIEQAPVEVSLRAVHESALVERTLHLVPPRPGTAAVLSTLQSKSLPEAEEQLATLPPFLRAEARFLLTKTEAGRAQPLTWRLDQLRTVESEAKTLGANRLSVRARVYQAYLWLREGWPSRALQDLETLSSSSQPAFRLMIDVVAGMAHYDAGNFAKSQSAFERVETWATRLGAESALGEARRWLLYLSEFLGPPEEALRRAKASLTRLQKLSAGCDRLQEANALLWWTLVRYADPVAALRSYDEEDVEAASSQARSYVEEDIEGCPLQKAEAAVNLGLDALRRKDPENTQRWLSAAERFGVAPRDELWLKEGWARLHLLQKRPKRALKAVKPLRLSPLPPVQLAALAISVSALKQQGDVKHALLLADEARALIDAWPASVELERGWSSLLAHLSSVVQVQIRLLLDAGQTKEAFQVARWERQRAFRSRWQTRRVESLSDPDRAVWEAGVAKYLAARSQYLGHGSQHGSAQALRRAKEALRGLRQRFLSDASTSNGPIRPGSLVLLTNPGPEAWTLFAATHAEVLAWPLAPLGSQLDALNRAFEASLDRLGPQLRSVQKVELLMQGPTWEVDLHSLLWNRAPLIESKSVVYRVDGLEAPVEPPSAGSSVVIADPSGDLPSALASGQQLAARLRADKVPVTTVFGPDASFEATRRSIQEAETLYFFGHAQPVRSGSIEGGLQLARTELLTSEDVLSMRRAPRRVLLGVCGGAAERTPGPIGPRLGIAQAFVLKGAQAVLATTRPVADQMAGRLEAAVLDAPTWLSAIRTIAKEHPAEDWAAFRFFEP